jgi:hypothetical protein
MRDNAPACKIESDANPRGLRVRTGLRAGIGMPLGDAVAAVTHATGLDRLADVYTQVTGRDCGCEARRQLLNQLFPF